jgi:acetylglutamate kinase
MEGCLHAVRNGVRTARVIDGRVEHSILLEIFTDEGIGTMVVPDDEPPVADRAPGAITEAVVDAVAEALLERGVR